MSCSTPLLRNGARQDSERPCTQGLSKSVFAPLLRRDGTEHMYGVHGPSKFCFVPHLTQLLNVYNLGTFAQRLRTVLDRKKLFCKETITHSFFHLPLDLCFAIHLLPFCFKLPPSDFCCTSSAIPRRCCVAVLVQSPLER